jgi:organic radical activating enzyme
MRETGGDGMGFCVLTGGEPLLQADAELVRALHAEGFEVAVETNGTVALAEAFGADEAHWPDWITCSPKLPEERLRLEHFDELKLVVPDYRPVDYARFARRGRAHRGRTARAAPLAATRRRAAPRRIQARGRASGPAA